MSNSGGGLGNAHKTSQSTTTNANTTNTSTNVAVKGSGTSASRSQVARGRGAISARNSTITINKTSRGALKAGETVAVASLHAGVNAFRDMNTAEAKVLEASLGLAGQSVNALRSESGQLAGITSQAVTASPNLQSGNSKTVAEIAVIGAVIVVFVVARGKK